MQCGSCGASLTADQLFCPRCGAPASAAAGTQAPVSNTAAQLGRAIGAGYEIGELIGRGGFGEVYAAADRSLKRTVAIKVLRADMADTRHAIDRFRREAEALARLRHPHIMPVYGIGEAEGLTYFVMPRIEGESLADLFGRSERLSLADACRVIAETADALAAAHRAGVVHRDIKPDNILLEGEERHALLMDFGIAKSGGAEGKLTATGMIIGTPMYMSPEQATGDHIGPASDIYSLGVVAWELLAGESIFGTQTSPQQVVAAHLAQAPRDLRDVNPAVPKAIATAVMRCLRKEPAQRWPSTLEFVRAFAQARADLPRDPEIVIPDAAPALSRRGRMLVLGGALAGAVVTFGNFRGAEPSLGAPYASRDVALAQAESLLTELGLPRYRDRAWGFSPMGSVGAFLENRPGGPPPAPTLSRVPLGEWRFAFYTRGTPGYARVTIGGAGWASRFDRVVDTTGMRSQVADLVVDTAVTATLRTMGWNPDSLRPLDSTRTIVDGRTTLTWRWTPVGEAGLVAGGDTVTRRVSMTFTDGQLVSYETSASLPPVQAARANRRSTVNVTVATVLVLLLAGVATDLALAHRRRALRLPRALALAGAHTTLLMVALILISVSNSSGPLSSGFLPERSQLGYVLGNGLLLLVILGPLFLLATGALFAASEAVALRADPALLAGYPALAGRPRPGRLAAPARIGTALGLALAGAVALAGAATAWLSGIPLRADQSWTQSHLEAVAQLAVMAGLALPAAALATLLLAHLGASGRLLRATPVALLMGGASAGVALLLHASGPGAAMIGVGAAGLALVAARRGIVEAAVAMLTMWLTVSVATAWQAPYSDPWPVTIATALVLAVALAATRVRTPATAAPLLARTPSSP